MTTASSAPLDWGAVEVRSGGGVVHRGPDVLLVVPMVTEGLTAAAEELIALCALTPDPTGRRRFRQAARLLADAEPEDVPGFVLMIATDDHLAVLAHGAVTVSVTGAQDVSFSAAEALSWVERTIDRSFETLTVEGTPANVEGAPAAEPAGHGATAGALRLPLDLLAGTVPGGGATVRSRAPGRPPAKQGTEPAERGAAPPEQEVARVLERPAYLPAHGASVASARTGSTGTAAVRAAPEPGQPAPDHARASVAGSVEGATQGSAQGSAEGSAEGSAPGSAEGRTEGRTVMRPTVAVKRVSLRPQDRVGARVRRAPLPRGAVAAPSPASGGPVVLIEGVTCPSGHLNESESATCGPCGARIDAAAPRVTRARPPLGVLVTDDGAVYTVTGDYVIGREPEQAPDVKAGTARALVLQDGEHSTSRVHARLELSGWSVLLKDSGSANGTFLSRGGAAGPWTVVPREPGTPLRPGDRVRLGKRQLLFDRYHVRATPLQPTGRQADGPHR